MVSGQVCLVGMAYWPLETLCCLDPGPGGQLDLLWGWRNVVGEVGILHDGMAGLERWMDVMLGLERH